MTLNTKIGIFKSLFVLYFVLTQLSIETIHNVSTLNIRKKSTYQRYLKICDLILKHIYRMPN